MISLFIILFLSNCLQAREFNSKAAKAIWDLNGKLYSCGDRRGFDVDCIFSLGIYATSRHIPGVRFAGVTHPGLIGTAPSAELLATWNKREGELIEAHGVSVPPVAFPPEPIGAYVGQDLDPELFKKIAKEGARTVPGREHGGNCDVCLLRVLRVSFHRLMLARL